MRDVLPLKTESEESSGVSDSLLSAFLIGQRMNRETDRELKAHCLAFDDESGEYFTLISIFLWYMKIKP